MFQLCLYEESCDFYSVCEIISHKEVMGLCTNFTWLPNLLQIGHPQLPGTTRHDRGISAEMSMSFWWKRMRNLTELYSESCVVLLCGWEILEKMCVGVALVQGFGDGDKCLKCMSWFTMWLVLSITRKVGIWPALNSVCRC